MRYRLSSFVYSLSRLINNKPLDLDSYFYKIEQMVLSLRLSLFIFLLIAPETVLAHSPIKGIGAFFNGILHPLLVPVQVLAILSLGLYYGQNQPTENKMSVIFYLIALIFGLVATRFFPADNDVSIVLLLGVIMVTLLIISNYKLAKYVYRIAGLLFGFILGLDSAQNGLNLKATLLTLFGSGVGIYFLLLYAMALSESFSKKTWQNIAVRVLASWMSASALMVLALNFMSKG